MLTIDGSRGEGGGQILRTALALSTITGTPFRIDAIRAGRKKPGLMRQHLTCVQAAANICGAEVSGAELGATSLAFKPATVKAGRYHFAMGGAGSTTLVLQTVLFALLRAQGMSEVVLEGGTHNPMSPPFDFLARTFLPLLARMGARVEARLERPGFYPAGGGRIVVSIEGTQTLTPLALLNPLVVQKTQATAMVSNLPRDIAERELAVIGAELGLAGDALQVVELKRATGPGNVVSVAVVSDALTEVFTGFGEKGVSAEEVAKGVVVEVRELLDAGVPVARHLADQLLMPLVLAGGGAFRTLSLSQHAETQVETLRLFLDAPIVTRRAGAVTTVEIGGR